MSELQIGISVLVVCAVFFVGFLLGIYHSKTTYGSWSSEEDGCQFCKTNVVIKAYRKGKKEEKRIAHFCPICGRKLKEITENSDTRY